MLNVRNFNDFRSRFQEILIGLEDVYHLESDSKKDSISALVNYYSIIVGSFFEFAPEAVLEIKELIKKEYLSKRFTFLYENIINDICNIDLSIVYYIVKKDIYDLKKLFDSLWQEYHYLAHDFLVNTRQNNFYFKQHNTPKIFPDLTRSEKSFLFAICQGLYETKQVAIYLNLSVRTIEGLMRSVSHKLECKNRYELFVKIGSDYSCLSHVMADN